MKKLLVTFFAVLLLSGCALVPKFDNAEYNHVVELTEMVQHTSMLCGQPKFIQDNTRELIRKATVVDLYASYKPLHKEIKEITTLILANIKEFDHAYWYGAPPSRAYCTGKLKIIENSLKRVLPVIGGLQ